MKWRPLWDYIRERERIRFQKMTGKPAPWTDDPILQKFKFTNVKRIYDRTTQAFLEVYRKYASAPHTTALYNCALRRFTGTAAASTALGWVEHHDPKLIQAAERACDNRGETFWTGAYMIRGGAAGVPKWRAVSDYLVGVWDSRKALCELMERTRSWEKGYAVMHELYGFGGNGFMGKEVLQDYILWRTVAKLPPFLDADTFTPVGPGARRGLNRLRGKPLGTPMTESEGLQMITALRTAIQPLWRKAAPNEQPLTAHDIQFCLCELDKYERVRLGEGRPRSLYKPPKEE